MGCRAAQGKRQLVRIVRTPDQRIIIDPTGKGRGAYLHPIRPCWVKALKGATIKNALKISPVAEDVEALRAFGDALPAQESEGS
ncbi:MAG TPA: YlxR family protein [Tepidiformaceae bacterium]|nr:YlxR family protein [Tepidiformaceae bacterium]